MIRAFVARLHQGYRTNRFPAADPMLSPRYRGLPEVFPEKCTSCGLCESACPAAAISIPPTAPKPILDLGRCIFCGECARVCPEKVMVFSGSFRMGARKSEDLLVGGPSEAGIEKLGREMLARFGHSMKFRVVSAGGCNACEADVNVLETIGFDLSRFGLSYAASPRHADGLIITGPVSKNMEEALKKTWEAMPSPKIAIAIGACAISGGIYRGLPDTSDGATGIIPIDLFIPGCPPHPMTILNGLLALLGRLPEKE